MRFLKNDWGNFEYQFSVFSGYFQNYLCVFWKTTEVILNSTSHYFLATQKLPLRFLKNDWGNFEFHPSVFSGYLKIYLCVFWKTTEVISSSASQYFLATQKLPLRFLRNDWGNYAFSGQAPLIVFWLSKITFVFSEKRLG